MSRMWQILSFGLLMVAMVAAVAAPAGPKARVERPYKGNELRLVLRRGAAQLSYERCQSVLWYGAPI